MLKPVEKYEYDEDNPTTWQVWTPPPKDIEFERELFRIGGYHANGKPNLRLVWGGTEKDDRTEHKTQLKYHCGYTVPQTVGWKYIEDGQEHFTSDIEKIPPTVLGVVPVIKRQALGLCRWIIERYTPPEELEAKNRFTNRKGENDFTVLRSFPREGIYETWLVIDSREHKYRDVGSDLLEFITAKWNFEQKSVAEQKSVYAEWQVKQERLREEQRLENWIWAMDESTKLPDDERERRAFLAAKLKEAEEHEARQANSLIVYQSTY